MTLGNGIPYPLGEDETPLRCSQCGHTWVGYDDQMCPFCDEKYWDEHPDPNGALHEPRKPSSWTPVDLQPALAGDDIPPPTQMEREDGICLLYPGKVHWFQGESESLKSWAAQYAAAQVLLTPSDDPYMHNVLYIDFEDDDRGVVGRLRALGVPADAIRERFKYVRPIEPLSARNGAVTWASVDLYELTASFTNYSIAILDGVTEAMSLEGLDLISNQDISTWIKMLPRRLADTGAAVAVIDHVTKSKEGRGRFAIGGQHKLAGIDGAAYGFECTRPLSRALVAPIEGRAIITVHKDRPGFVRARARDGVIGTLELVAYPDGGVTAKITTPDALSSAPDPILRAKILAYCKVYEGCSKAGLETGITGYAAAIRAATGWLVANEQLEVRKEGVAHRHYITEIGLTALAETDEVAA
jgi:hypothetical protein